MTPSQALCRRRGRPQAYALNGVSSKQANSDVAQGLQGLAEVLTNGTHPPFKYGTIAIGQDATASNTGEHEARCPSSRLETLLSWPESCGRTPTAPDS